MWNGSQVLSMIVQISGAAIPYPSRMAAMPNILERVRRTITLRKPSKKEFESVAVVRIVGELAVGLVEDHGRRR